jgi:hypothetical protein
MGPLDGIVVLAVYSGVEGAFWWKDDEADVF